MPATLSSAVELSPEDGLLLWTAYVQAQRQVDELLPRLIEREAQLEKSQTDNASLQLGLVTLQGTLLDWQRRSARLESRSALLLTELEETANWLRESRAALKTSEASFAGYSDTMRSQVLLLERRAKVLLVIAIGSAAVAVVAIIVAAAQ